MLSSAFVSVLELIVLDNGAMLLRFGGRFLGFYIF